MMRYYTKLVKLYSVYTELTPAPFGFDVPCRPIDPQRWHHIPAEGSISFSIINTEGNTLMMKVEKNGSMVEMTNIDLLGSDKYIQFSARSPSISCKYIVGQGTELYIKRFQIALQNENDFVETCNTLSYLRFVVKNARPSIRLNTFLSQASQSSQIPSETIPSHNKEIEDIPNHVQSQTALGLSNLAQVFRFGWDHRNKGANESEARVTVCPIEAEVSTKEPRHNGSGVDLGVALIDDLSVDGTSNAKKKDITAISTVRIENAEGLPEIAPQSQKTSVQTTLDSEPSQVRNKNDPVCAEISRLASGDDKCSKVLQEVQNKEIPVYKSSEKQSTQVTLHLDSKTKKVDFPIKIGAKEKHQTSLKISKKTIKQKLKDDDFMKWVAEVERTLFEMSRIKK